MRTSAVFAVLLAAMELAACSQLRETHYNYLPPKDAQGLACVAQCSAANSACLTEADKLAAGERDRCELESRQEYDLCLSRPHMDASPSCEPRRCPVSDEAAACDPVYRACFEHCGGTVEAQQVCLDCN